MRTIGETALWLAVVLAAWGVTTAVAGARRDERLARSGGRSLHVIPVLLLVVLGGRIAASMSELSGAPPAIAGAIAVRELWSDPSSRLALWALAVAVFAAGVPVIVRRDPRELRVRAQLRAAILSLLFSAAAAGASLLIPGSSADGDGGGAPIAVHVPPGIAGRLLLVLGCAAVVIPLAIARERRHRAHALRWSIAALALVLAGLTLLGYVHYALVSAPSVIDPSGTPTAAPWTSLSALWLLPPLLIGALSYRLPSEGEAPDTTSMRATEQRAALLLLVGLVIVVVIAAVAPAVVDWTQARDIALGFELQPPLVVLVALPAFLSALAILVLPGVRRGALRRSDALASAMGGALLVMIALSAGVRNAGTIVSLGAGGMLAGLLAARAVRATGAHERSLWLAQCGVVLAAASALAAISVRPAQVEAIPGTPAEVTLAGRTWQVSSQGASQDETPGYDGIVIAFDVRSSGGSRIVTTGERAYRDAHGHAATRAAVPAVVRGPLADLRLVVRGTRGDSARLELRHHPLATIAWITAAATVVALLVAAGAPPATVGHPEEVRP